MAFRADGPFCEHIRLALQPPVLVDVLQGAEQIVGGVLVKDPRVGAGIDGPELCVKGVIGGVQLRLLRLDVPVRVVLKLVLDQVVHELPQADHPGHAPLCRVAQLHRLHDAVLPEVDLPVHQGIGEVLYIRVGGDGAPFGGLVRDVRLVPLHRLIAAVDMGNGLPELFRKVGAGSGGNGAFLPPVLCAFGGQLAQHHLRMVYKIAVEGKALRGLPQVYPIRLDVDGTVPLLQEQDVRDYLRPGVGFESVVGQADRPQQLRPLRDILPGIRAFGIHRVAAGDKGHHAARTHLVDGLGKEIVVDGEAQPVVGLVVHLVVAKGDIPDTEVEEVPPVGGLETGHLDVRLRVQLLGDAPGDGVQLHTVEAAALHGLREQSEEIAHAHAGFQDIARLESHLLHRVIDRPDHGGAGVVGVEGGRSGSGVFLRGEGGIQFPEFACPAILFLVKGIRQTAPAHIAGKDLLLLWRGVPAVELQLMQEVDGVHVGPELRFGSALAQMVVRNAEIAGGGLLGLLRLSVFRLPEMQPFNDHIKGQAVLIAGIDGLGGGGDFRLRANLV